MLLRISKMKGGSERSKKDDTHIVVAIDSNFSRQVEHNIKGWLSFWWGKYGLDSLWVDKIGLHVMDDRILECFGSASANIPKNQISDDGNVNLIKSLLRCCWVHKIFVGYT